MSKLIVAAAAAASFLAATAAQAQDRTRERNAQREPLSAYQAYGPVAREEPTDMKVMGLRVPNGWRTPGAVEGAAN